jgi:short-subunit dehydrogenase
MNLAAQGLNIALVARKRPALEEAAAALRGASKVEVRTLSQDMTAPDATDAIREFTSDIDVGLMVYNAGAMDRITTFLGDSIEGHLHTLRLNCEGPTRMCHHFGGRMRDRQRGGIVLMSSVSGLAGSYGVPIYGATKAFDMILGEGLWYEFKDFGVSVLTAVLGSVSTPSHERLFRWSSPGRRREARQRCPGSARQSREWPDAVREYDQADAGPCCATKTDATAGQSARERHQRLSFAPGSQPHSIPARFRTRGIIERRT